MVAPAEEAGVLQAGFAAVDPVNQMVAVAPVGRTVATGESAALIADH
jgi:hypothetical protein